MAGRAQAPDDPRRCSAKSKQTGDRCKGWVVPGATVCRYHGGKAPQVLEAAEKRIQAMVHPALNALLRSMEDDDPKVRASAVTAARDVLDRAGYGATQKIDAKMDVSKDEFESDLKAYLLGRHDQFKESQAEVES